MIYLLLGEDVHSKDRQISEIKSKLLKSEAAPFDFESLDGYHLSASNLKKSLLALPTLSPKRLILIRHGHKLKNDTAEVLLSFVRGSSAHCDVIVEAVGDIGNGRDKSVGNGRDLPVRSLLKNLAPYAKMFTFGVKPESNVFDMTRLMSARKTTEALKKLHEFYQEGIYPLQLMGALVWYWGKEGRALGSVKFERGLKALQEADLNIKRSRLDPEYAIEKLVVELVELRK